MALVLFDSNILIGHTLGYSEARSEIAAYDHAAISAITCNRATELRGVTRKQLTDCIIRATADVEGRVVITRNAVDAGGFRWHIACQGAPALPHRRWRGGGGPGAGVLAI